MKITKFVVSLMISSTFITGCSSATQKHETKEKVNVKAKKKKTAAVAKQDIATLPDTTESKPVVESGISAKFSDDELIAYANEIVNKMYQERMSYICGTHFSVTSDSIRTDQGIYYLVNDEQVQNFNDIQNVYYQKFSNRYPICYDKPYNLEPLNEVPFVEQDGKLYASNKAICIYGHGSQYVVGELTAKSDDEFWVRLDSYCSLDDSMIQTDITCSFVWDGTSWKYGDFNNPNFYKVD